jgi:hypothetical protein
MIAFMTLVSLVFIATLLFVVGGVSEVMKGKVPQEQASTVAFVLLYLVAVAVVLGCILMGYGV